MAGPQTCVSNSRVAYRLWTYRRFVRFSVLTLSVHCPRIMRATQFPSSGISTTTDVRSASCFENHAQVSVESEPVQRDEIRPVIPGRCGPTVLDALLGPRLGQRRGWPRGT